MSLMEVVLIALLGSGVLLSASQLFIQLRVQYQQLHVYRQQQEAITQLLDVIEKDVKRAGYCAGRCQHDIPPIKIDALSGEAPASCLLVSYDLDSNGRLQAENELFAYRLRHGALESGRGVADCQGGQWRKISDERQWWVNHFLITHKDQHYQLHISLSPLRHKERRVSQTRWIVPPNAN